MANILFEDWCKNYFCPEVKKYLMDNNLSNKTLFRIMLQGTRLKYPNYLTMWRLSIFPKMQPMDQDAELFENLYTKPMVNLQ